MNLAERVPGMEPGNGRRNWIVGAVYVIAILAVIGAVSPDDADEAPEIEGGDATPTEAAAADGGAATTPTQTEADEPEPTPTTTRTPTATATPPPEPDPQRVSGSGGDVTDAVSVEGGFTTFELSHTGESNFQVELVDAGSGESQEFLANAIGDYDGTVGLFVPPGDYLLDVTADGSWEATVEQPRFDSGDVEAPPVSESGEQAAWMGPIDFDGAVEVSVEATGDGNLGVWLADVNGERVELLANDIAPFETSTIVGQDGVGVLLIETDSAGWRIEVSR